MAMEVNENTRLLSSMSMENTYDSTDNQAEARVSLSRGCSYKISQIDSTASNLQPFVKELTIFHARPSGKLLTTKVQFERNGDIQNSWGVKLKNVAQQFTRFMGLTSDDYLSKEELNNDAKVAWRKATSDRKQGNLCNNNYLKTKLGDDAECLPESVFDATPSAVMLSSKESDKAKNYITLLENVATAPQFEKNREMLEAIEECGEPTFDLPQSITSKKCPVYGTRFNSKNLVYVSYQDPKTNKTIQREMSKQGATQLILGTAGKVRLKDGTFKQIRLDKVEQYKPEHYSKTKIDLTKQSWRRKSTELCTKGWVIKQLPQKDDSPVTDRIKQAVNESHLSVHTSTKKTGSQLWATKLKKLDLTKLEDDLKQLDGTETAENINFPQKSVCPVCGDILTAENAVVIQRAIPLKVGKGKSAGLESVKIKEVVSRRGAELALLQQPIETGSVRSKPQVLPVVNIEALTTDNQSLLTSPKDKVSEGWLKAQLELTDGDTATLSVFPKKIYQSTVKDRTTTHLLLQARKAEHLQPQAFKAITEVTSKDNFPTAIRGKKCQFTGEPLTPENSVLMYSPKLTNTQGLMRPVLVTKTGAMEWVASHTPKKQEDGAPKKTDSSTSLEASINKSVENSEETKLTASNTSTHTEVVPLDVTFEPVTNDNYKLAEPKPSKEWLKLQIPEADEELIKCVPDRLLNSHRAHPMTKRWVSHLQKLHNSEGNSTHEHTKKMMLSLDNIDKADYGIPFGTMECPYTDQPLTDENAVFVELSSPTFGYGGQRKGFISREAVQLIALQAKGTTRLGKFQPVTINKVEQATMGKFNERYPSRNSNQ